MCHHNMFLLIGTAEKYMYVLGMGTSIINMRVAANENYGTCDFQDTRLAAVQDAEDGRSF